MTKNSIDPKCCSGVCQSCGMPMKKDPNGGGAEKDGSKSSKYCSFCYQKGEFTSSEITTPEEMQKFCINIMKKEQKIPKFIGWILTRGIPKLDRWER